MRLGLIVGMVGSLAGTATVAGATYLALEQFKSAAVESQLKSFEKLKDVLDIDVKYRSTSGDVMSGSFALEQVTVVSDDKRVDVERIEFRNFDWKNAGQPRFGAVVLTGMKFKGDVFSVVLGPEIGKVLEEDQKFENVIVDAALEHEVSEEEVEDPKTKRKVRQNKVTIKELKIAFRDLATFTAAIELRDFAVKPKAVARQAREEPPLVRLLGENVLFAGMRLVFDDKGLMKAFIDAKARELSKGELQARGHFVRELQKDAQTARSSVGSNRLDGDFFRPMIHYIERSDRFNGFTLESKPPQPIELRRLYIMADQNRGGFFDKFSPKLTIGPARAAAPKREEPRKKEEPKRERRR